MEGSKIRAKALCRLWRSENGTIRAAVVEQQEQLIQHVLHVARPAGDGDADAEDRADVRRVAEEDAEVAAEILAKGTAGGTRRPNPAARKTIAAGGPPVRGDAGATRTLTAGPTTLTDEVINSFFPAHCIIKLTLSLFPIVAGRIYFCLAMMLISAPRGSERTSRWPIRGGRCRYCLPRS